MVVPVMSVVEMRGTVRETLARLGGRMLWIDDLVYRQ